MLELSIIIILIVAILVWTGILNFSFSYSVNKGSAERFSSTSPGTLLQLATSSPDPYILGYVRPIGDVETEIVEDQLYPERLYTDDDYYNYYQPYYNPYFHHKRANRLWL